MASPTDARPRHYEPALDGLRALAVVAVLLYHNGGSGAPGGFLGVDAFFVLSGFLITTLLVREWGNHRGIDLVAFWGRRIRRLLPALLVLLAGVAIYAVFVASASERHAIRIDSIATLFYVENWRLVFAHHSYFDTFAAPSPLRHAWSLAIEEQWYLVWPIALAFMLRLARGRVGRVLAVVVALAAASATLMFVLYDPHADPSRVYYGTDTRAQALLIGSAVALILRMRGHVSSRRGRVTLEAAGVLGAGFVLALVIWVHDTSSFLYRGGLTAAALAVAVLIVAAVHPHGVFLRRALSWRPLVAIGLVSYGIYLFHWPVFLWLTPTRTGLFGWQLLAVRTAVTALIAVASYWLIEMPVRRGSPRPATFRVALPAAAAAVVIVLVASTAGVRESTPILASTAFPGSAPLPGATPDSVRAVHRRPAPGNVRVLVSGDSVAHTLVWTKAPPVSALGVDVADGSIVGCGVAGGTAAGDEAWMPEGCASWPAVYRARVDAVRPDVSLLMIGAWELIDHDVGGRIMRVGTDSYRTYILDQLDVARQILTAHGALLVIAVTPCFNVPIRNDNDFARAQDDPARAAWLAGVERAYADAHPADVRVVDFNELFCADGHPHDSIAGATVRVDGMHFTPDTALTVWKWLAPRLRAIAAR